MKTMKPFLFACTILIPTLFSCTSNLEKDFKNPPDEFRPMPFWHINGELTTEGIREQMEDAREAGFSGVSLLPLATYNHKVGTSPKFLSEAYFERFRDMLDVAEELDMEVILYDDNDFPSGMAGGLMQEHYPELCQKRLDKVEKEVTGPSFISERVPGGQMMAAVAMNTVSLERIDLRTKISDGMIKWKVPEGKWKLMFFPMVLDEPHKKYMVTDMLDTIAVAQMISFTYDSYYERFSSSFGNTIKMTFFDDVGFWRHPRTWTGSFNEKFRELNGFDPEPWYPALWYNIGPETEAIRYAFFLTRAELLAEGYPRLVGRWAREHGVKDTGHPPGNYDPTPVDMNGDIFKFYRHTAVPLTDAIIAYQFGQNGHKLISSAADYYDRPLVATEIYGAYRENTFDSLMLYRSMMDMFVRGVNLVIPHGMWYDPEKVYIPPLVSPYSEKIAPALPAYSDYVGRASILLRGGRRVSEIGLVYPFESLAGWYRFEDPDNPRQGFFVSPETDYQDISGILTNELRRDFTFVHPELFLDPKYSIADGVARLNNQENFQEYSTLILPGCNIISHKTLDRIKEFYEKGGTIIATTRLPFKSAERGQDQQVIRLIGEIFGIDPLQPRSISGITENASPGGGSATFLPQPDAAALQEVLAKHSPPADVGFIPNPELKTDFGKFSYIHKVKDGKDIYFFANSSDEPIQTSVLLKGKQRLEQWDPHTGEILDPVPKEILQENGQEFTRFDLELAPVSSLFMVEE